MTSRIFAATIGARTFVEDWIAMEDYLKSECQDLNFTVFKLPLVQNNPYIEGKSTQDILIYIKKFCPGKMFRLV